MTAVLEVKELIYTHRIRRSIFSAPDEFVLGPISFAVNAGETLALTGHNGSGKTLLAKALVGAIQPQQGSILLEGKEVEQSDKKTRNHDIRLILQHSNTTLNKAVTVGNVLNQTLQLNTKLDEQDRKAKIEQTLVRVGLLREHYYFYRHMLSDGQQQRVSLARAMILDPKIIIADEPFAALDPSVRSQTVNLILDIQRDLGMAFIFISQNLGIVRHISDTVMIIDKGKVIESGKTARVFQNPQHELTQKLIDSHFSLVDKHFGQF
ncbi:ATP-binding cassette domain-containing protein [Glaciecola sp. MH2013]|uniref:ATP-binding cassette domain-containing protein n=1 Tax=Glaciecola sp. MH2013 TaxID=2785524 RepID=UPI0018A11FA2|nr:ATP-binding cassette domain-containing protein [Glaciecola sp. MH2013]MBF7072418.1 ATP-binding cassette domain-containing protein [Glaciecola sp. MH2013]